MSDSTVYNLLKPDAVKGYRLVPGYAWPGFGSPHDWTQKAACVPGKSYTLSIVTNVAGEVCFGFYLADGSVSRPNGYEAFPAGKSVVRTLTAPAGAKYVAASWAGGNRRPMVVEGDTPAAWAPAEGETLAGGGASMSANLWKAENVTPAENPEDGIYACSGTRGVRTNVTLGRLSANQTFHCGFSVNPGKDGKFTMALCYRDAADRVNYAFAANVSVPAGKWTRVSQSVVVPSDMTVYQMVICNNNNAPDASGWKVTNPTLSLGSAVVLAQAEATVSYIKDGKSPTISVSKSGTVTTITVTNPDGSKSTQKVLDGTAGTPGAKGADGRTTYTHVKYSNDNGKTFTSNSGEDAGAYIGICTDFNAADPTTVSSYKWAKIKGEQGDRGPQGPKGETGATGAPGPQGADGQMLVATSSTAAGTAAKVATLKAGSLALKPGASVTVVFSQANTATNPTLNVNNTGAKAIHTNGTPYAYWVAGTAVSFVYDGTYWQVCSVPVYASTVTVGNPSASNVYIDNDSVDLRMGTKALAQFSKNEIKLGDVASKINMSGVVEVASTASAYGPNGIPYSYGWISVPANEKHPEIPASFMLRCRTSNGGYSDKGIVIDWEEYEKASKQYWSCDVYVDGTLHTSGIMDTGGANIRLGDTGWQYLYNGGSANGYVKYRKFNNLVILEFSVLKEMNGLWMAGTLPPPFWPDVTMHIAALTVDTSANPLDHVTGAIVDSAGNVLILAAAHVAGQWAEGSGCWFVRA